MNNLERLDLIEKYENKIRNLVYAMSKKDKTIENIGTNRFPKWIKKR